MYSLFSHNEDIPIVYFDNYDREAFLTFINNHLSQNKTDTLELCREYDKKSIKKYYGVEILKFYKVNPKNGKPSEVVLKGSKEYFRATNLKEVV